MTTNKDNKEKWFTKFRRQMISWTSDYVVDCEFRNREDMKKNPLVMSSTHDLHEKLCRRIWNYFEKALQAQKEEHKWQMDNLTIEHNNWCQEEMEAQRKEITEKIFKMEKEGRREIDIGSESSTPRDYRRSGYNQALQDFLNQIYENK